MSIPPVGAWAIRETPGEGAQPVAVEGYSHSPATAAARIALQPPVPLQGGLRRKEELTKEELDRQQRGGISLREEG